MAQTVRLTLRTTGGTSDDIVVAAGASVMIGIYTDGSAGLPDVECTVIADTPGTPDRITTLNRTLQRAKFDGPATYNVVVPAVQTRNGVAASNIGVWSE